MTVQSDIENKLSSELNPSYMEVINESMNHNVPVGSESHFKLIIVSNQFDNKNLLERHRMVNKILQDELQNKIHALAIHAYTQQQWQEINAVVPESPPCLGGSK